MAAHDAYTLGTAIYDGEPWNCIACPGDDDEEPAPEPNTSAVVLVFDMRNPVAGTEADQLGQWYEWTPPATVDVGRGPAGVVHQGVWHWIDQDAVVRAETPDQWYDDTDTQIRTRLTFGLLSLAGALNAERTYRIQVDGDYRGASTQTVTCSIVRELFGAPTTWTKDVVLTAADEEFEFQPNPSGMTAIGIDIQEAESADLTEGYAVKVVGMELGSNGKLRRVNADQRR